MRRESDVLIVGAGPVGLALALGLARHGVRSTLVERRPSTSRRSKAPGILARTLEILHQWGVADEILTRAIFLPSVTIHSSRTDEPLVTVPVDELTPECRYAGLCILEQGTTERVLLDAVRATALCDVRFEHDLLRLEPREREVEATLRAPGSEEARHVASYVVGCDGANSTVRRLLGLPFDGITYPLDGILADVRIGEAAAARLPFPRVYADEQRLVLVLRLESGSWRIVSAVPGSAESPPEGPAGVEVLRPIVEVGLGAREFDCVWSSRFRIHRRCVDRFRVGRVLLAGDAAHVNSPVGAQGMNSGIQDAHNLAWKLAAALGGGDEERLLESYDVERRHRVRTGVNRFTDLATRAVLAPAPLRNLLARQAARALRIGALRRPMLRRATMLSGRYPASPLIPQRRGPAGDRIPDVALQGPGGPARLHDLLGAEAAVVLIEAPPPEPPGAHGVPTLTIGPDHWSEPTGILASRFGSPRVLIVRPDHYVGWAGTPGNAAELDVAIGLALGRTRR